MKLLRDSIDIIKLCCNPVVLKKKKKKLVKLLKLAMFGANLYRKGFSMDHVQNEKTIFLAEITKTDYQLSETFCFISWFVEL